MVNIRAKSSQSYYNMLPKRKWVELTLYKSSRAMLSAVAHLN